MPWTELSFNATPEAIDWIRTLLAATEYSDELHISRADLTPWAFTVYLYFPSAARMQLNAVVDRLTPLYRTDQISALETTIVAAKRSLPAAIHRVGDRFVILSPQTDYSAQTDEIVLQIEDSRSFGSGFHPATILSLQQIERQILPGMKVLDLGCGSGILSVAMAKLGAEVLALDNDPIAVAATQAAVDRNHVAATVRLGSLGQGNDLGHWMGEGHLATPIPAEPIALAPMKVDVIVANILARIHIALAPDYYAALESTAGLLITAGFTVDYEQDVAAALETAGFKAIGCDRFKDWAAFVHQHGGSLG
jgi:ribosomal protein L11 methyltransferase